MRADLHIHTTYSDGTLSPEQVARRAREAGLGMIAVCDHNTAAALPRLAAACALEGIAIIPGAEIDADDLVGGRHILAYGCDFAHPGLVRRMDENLVIMEQVSIDLIDRMRHDDPRLSAEEYAAYVRVPERGGWKGIDYLRDKGYPIAYPDCMRHYARYGCRPAPFATVAQVCALIHAAGGKAVMAHPYERLPGTLAEHLPRWVDDGVDGLECLYPAHTPGQRAEAVALCRAQGLLITGGCDCHGDFATDIDGTHYALGTLDIDTWDLALGGLFP